MKRTWIGGGILAALLVAGILTGWLMDARMGTGAAQLRQAGDCALAGDWEKAEALTESARAAWERAETLAEVLSSHEQLEQIGTSFAQLPSYLRQDGAAYSALCAALAAELDALGKAHGCSWENLL